MPRTVEVSEDDLAWLDEAITNNITYAAMARKIGCDRTTLKRILHRHGLAEFEGAKFQTRDPEPKWTRPCSRCGCTKPRTKWKFYCWPCAEVLGHHEGAPQHDF